MEQSKKQEMQQFLGPQNLAALRVYVDLLGRCGVKDQRFYVVRITPEMFV